MATPGTEACDAVGGALRPKWREWPSQAIRRVLPERVAFGMLPAALFALLPSCRLFRSFFDRFRLADTYATDRWSLGLQLKL
jgi:hypothetical protein